MGVDKFLDLVKKFQNLDGKIIGEDGDFIKSSLSSTDKQAWTSHLAEQHLKKEPLDTPPPDLGIETQDVMKDLMLKEINKILGK
jgi:hypothetical protein